MNAKALAASDYAGLVLTEAAPKKLQIESVQYVHGMLIELEIPVTTFDLTQLGFCVPGAEPMTDKREINKSLIAFQALRAEKIAKISDADKAVLTSFLKNHTPSTDRSTQIQNTINDFDRSFRDHSNRAQIALTELWKSRDELMAIRMQGGKDWEAIIGEIVSDGFFKFYKIDAGNGWMEFTTAPVVCTSVKKVGDTRLSVEMGEYRVRMYPRGGEFQLWPSKRNRTTSNCIHPFVHENRICWGSAAPEIARCVKDGDVGKIFALLKSLLTTFESTNPYRPLEAFLNPAETNWVEPYAAFNNQSVGIHPDTKLSVAELTALTQKIRGDSKFHPVWCACAHACHRDRVNHYGGPTGQVGIKRNEDLCVDYTPKKPEPTKPKPEKQAKLKSELKVKHATKKHSARKPKIQTTASAVFFDEDWLSAPNNGF